MECGGCYSPANFPGEPMLRLAHDWAEAQPGDAEAFFDWDRSIIKVHGQELPLKETLTEFSDSQYEGLISRILRRLRGKK